MKLLTSDPELDDPLPIFQVLLNEAQLKRGGCDLLSVYKGLLRVFPLDENLWAKWCVRALDQGVGLPLIAQIVDMNLSGVVGWLVHLKLNYGLDVASYAKPANAASAWMKQDGVLVTKKEAEKMRSLDEVLWKACERNGHDKEVCRWFKGLSGKDDDAVIGGGELYRIWLGVTRQMYLKGVIDNTEVRERFRRLLGWAHSYVSKALKEYGDFERGVGGEDWKTRMLDEVGGSVEKSMSVWQQRGLNSYNWDNLAVEPTKGDDDVKLFRKIVAYEMTNPEKISDDAIARGRVREAFREGSKALYRTPEVWEEWARWETDRDLTNEVYEQAKHALPNCGLLVVSWAEGLEGSGDWKAAKKVYEDFLERCPCSLGFVMLERLVVRNMPDNTGAAREIFKMARRVLKQTEEDILKTDGSSTVKVVNTSSTADGEDPSQEQSTASYKGTMTYHVYLNHAMVEYKYHNNITVACRIFELGLEKHRSFLKSEKYIVGYAELLLELKDKENFRALISRALEAATEDENSSVSAIRRRQRPLWDMLLKFECEVALTQQDFDRVRDVELRRMKALGEDVDSGIPRTIMDVIVKNDGPKAILLPNSLRRMLQRVDLVVGGKDSGGDSDSRFAARSGLDTKEVYEDDNTGMTNMDRTQAARQKLEDQRAAEKSNIPQWIQILLDGLGRRRGNPPSHITELALQSLLHNGLPAKPDEKGPKYFDEDAGRAREKSDLTKGKRGREENSDEEDDDGGDNLFRSRQRRKVQ